MNLTFIPAHTTSHPDRFENEEAGEGFDVVQDTAADDPRGWIQNEHAALWVYRQPHIGGYRAAEKPEGNLAIDAFARFYDVFGDEPSLMLTRRWLRIYHPESTLQLEIQTIHGSSQSDWAFVVCAVEEGYGTPEAHINQYRMWAFGDVWVVIPDSGEPLGGIYADDSEEALQTYLAERSPEIPTTSHDEGAPPVVSTYTHSLTSTEAACGVTLDDVARELPRVLIRDGGATVIVDGTLAPALAASVARAAFGGREHTCSGLNHDLGLAIYRAVL